MTQNAQDNPPGKRGWAKLEGLSNPLGHQSGDKKAVHDAVKRNQELFAAVFSTDQGRQVLKILEDATIQRAAFYIDDPLLSIDHIAIKSAYRQGQVSVVAEMIDTVARGQKLKPVERDAEE